MRSLTVSPDSVKLKCIFEVGHDVMVLTDTSTPIDQIKQINSYGANVLANRSFTLVIPNIGAI